MAWEFSDDITPTMTSNSAPSPYVTSANAELDASAAAWKGFDDAASRWQTPNYTLTGWLKIDLAAANAAIVRRYTLGMNVNTSWYANRCPKDWTFQGSNNDSDWTTVDTQTGETSWSGSEVRTYTCTSNSTSYRYYRINVSAQNGDANYLWIGEVQLMTATPPPPPPAAGGGGFSGFSPWIFMKDMWEEHNKIWRPNKKILISQGI